ncbi:hypothetical protein M569_03765, partial [Genlisea aurea]
MAHPIHGANEASPYGNQTREEFYKKHRISHRHTFMLNQQSMKIFTQTWQPSDPTVPLKALIAMIHGYTSESSWLSELNSVAFAKAGFFVCALDLQGHGYSEGPPDHIPDLDPLIQDCIQYFDSIRAQYPKLPHFIYGESLGGSIAISVCLKQKQAWRGLILSGAMCEISKKFKLWPLDKLVSTAAFIAPSWRIGIIKPPSSISYREEWKRKLTWRSPTRKTCGKPTPASTLQFFKICRYIKNHCDELDVAMLVLHGGNDPVCDPQGARNLWERAASSDKTLKIYPDMWHVLIGEPNDRVEEAFNYMLSWIEIRA